MLEQMMLIQITSKLS